MEKLVYLCQLLTPQVWPASYQQLRLSTTSLACHIHVVRYITGSNLIAQVCLPLAFPLDTCEFWPKSEKTLKFFKKRGKTAKKWDSTQNLLVQFLRETPYVLYRALTALFGLSCAPAGHVDSSSKSTGEIISRKPCTEKKSYNTVYHVRDFGTNTRRSSFFYVPVNGR